MFLNLVFFIFAVAFVFWGSHYLVNAVVFLSQKFGVPILIIGLTVVTLGTSSPELLVGIWSALKNEAGLSLGNVLGANLANIGLIVGMITLIQPTKIKTSILRKESPFVILAPVILYLLAMDGLLSPLDGTILLIMAFLFIYYAVWSAGQGGGMIEKIKSILSSGDDRAEVVRQFFFLILGLILLVLGARFLVNSSVYFARHFGVSEIIIGITLVTVGTTSPELFTSIAALIKRKTEISLGNVIGATIFDIFIILGVVSVISPIIVPVSLINFDLLFLILFALIFVTLLHTSDRITRIEGAILLISYFSYIGFLLYRVKLGIL
jgi:cation:H+ antiporter